MNGPPAGFLFNVFLSDEDAREVRENIEQNQALMQSLDAEIAKAQAALQQLIKQRAETQRLLESNSAPSENAVRAIREIIVEKETLMQQLEGQIADAQAALDSIIERRAQVVECDTPLDAEIESARSVLAGLLKERDQTHQTLETHRALLSPIRRLPPEVLSEIFLHCVSTDSFIKASVAGCPLLLTQVSSSWRSVALATPTLWTSIVVNISPESCRPNPTLIQTWISRSGSRPLSFHIAESIQKDYYVDGITSASILQLYAPHYDRWVKVQLEYLDWRIETGFSELPCRTGPPQALESLHLARDFWHPSEFDQLSLLLSAPHLRNCTWISNTDVGAFPAPFSQLTTLFLERPVIAEDFMRILSEGTNIESSRFFVLASSGSTVGSRPSPPSVLRHKTLRSLELTADLFTRLFNQLELPALTNLSVRRFDIVPHPTPVWPHREFLSLLSRSHCALESISLSDMDITPLEMADCLRHTSASLEKLILTNDRRMRHTIIDDDVLRLLTWESAHLSICPRLMMLKFWDCHASSDGVLADMVESRWTHREGGPTKLLNIAFFMLDSTHTEDLRRLNSLNEERIGMSILQL